MVDELDNILTDPADWTWTVGMHHRAMEPASALLPGRVDAPASNREGSSAVGQFDSEAAAAAAADSLLGICVGETVILPNQPYPEEGSTGRKILAGGIDRLRSAGAHTAFITDADTGHLTYFDIRAHCENREQALAIGRQMAPVLWPPWVKGLIKPWAPGRRLSDEQVRARMYVASLWQRSDRSPRDALESKISDIWRAWQQEQEQASRRLVAGNAIEQEPAAEMHKHEATLHSLLGEESEEWGSPWYLHWKVRVENSDVCLSFLWCMRVATGFPALVRWLQRSSVQNAKYSVLNLMRP